MSKLRFSIREFNLHKCASIQLKGQIYAKIILLVICRRELTDERKQPVIEMLSRFKMKFPLYIYRYQLTHVLIPLLKGSFVALTFFVPLPYKEKL